MHNIHYAWLSAVFNPLHSISNQELSRKHLYSLHIPKQMVPRPNFINYRLKSEVPIMIMIMIMMIMM